MTEHVHSWAIMENTSREPAYLLCLCGELRSVSPHPSFTCPIEREPDPDIAWRWAGFAIMVCSTLVVVALGWWLLSVLNV